jgi:hypothetical protein
LLELGVGLIGVVIEAPGDVTEEEEVLRRVFELGMSSLGTLPFGDVRLCVEFGVRVWEKSGSEGKDIGWLVGVRGLVGYVARIINAR